MKNRMSSSHPILAALLLIALLFSPFAIGSFPVAANGVQPPATSTSTASTMTSGTTAASASAYPNALVVTHSAPNAIIIDASRGRVLYSKNSAARLVLPAANKIMTGLIAAEKLSLDTKITISKIAADEAASESTDDRVNLKVGDKYSVEYLLTRLFFYDSDAAAVALAEQVSHEEAEFVKLMNARAVTYSLSNTAFANASGNTVMRNTAVTESATPGSQVMMSAQYTTAAELATLVQMALMNDVFSKVFKKQHDYVVLDGTSLAPMSNRVSRLWPFSEGRVNGAFLSGSPEATCITSGTVNNFNIISITALGDSGQVVNDVLSLYDACKATYESTPLVMAGSLYAGAQETTLDGEVFGLVYQKTIYYIHPIGDMYLKQTIRYNSFGPYSRPIQRTMTIGQVIFELIDGTRIAADVTPDRQILSSISVVDRALSTLQSNRNLYYTLVIAMGLLLLILAVQAILLTFRLLRRRKTGSDSDIKASRRPF